jgi:hypothetical protein
MKCSVVDSLLSAYLDGELSESERSAVDEHLRGCASCAAMLRSLKTTAALVASLPRRQAPSGFAAAVLARVEAQVEAGAHCAPAPDDREASSRVAARRPPTRRRQEGKPAPFFAPRYAVAAVLLLGLGAAVYMALSPMRDDHVDGYAERGAARINASSLDDDLKAVRHPTDAAEPTGVRLAAVTLAYECADLEAGERAVRRALDQYGWSADTTRGLAARAKDTASGREAEGRVVIVTAVPAGQLDALRLALAEATNLRPLAADTLVTDAGIDARKNGERIGGMSQRTEEWRGRSGRADGPMAGADAGADSGFKAARAEAAFEVASGGRRRPTVTATPPVSPAPATSPPATGLGGASSDIRSARGETPEAETQENEPVAEHGSKQPGEEGELHKGLFDGRDGAPGGAAATRPATRGPAGPTTRPASAWLPEEPERLEWSRGGRAARAVAPAKTRAVEPMGRVAAEPTTAPASERPQSPRPGRPPDAREPSDRDRVVVGRKAQIGQAEGWDESARPKASEDKALAPDGAAMRRDARSARDGTPDTPPQAAGLGFDFADTRRAGNGVRDTPLVYRITIVLETAPAAERPAGRR